MAAVLASGPEAVLSHWSAAALWMIRPNSRSVIDVTCPHKSRTWDGIKRHHKALPGDEITVEEGIPVTTVPRTIFDLAATEPVDAVENLLREMERLELRDRLSLWHLLERYPGRRGVRRVQAALGRLEEEPPGFFEPRAKFRSPRPQTYLGGAPAGGSCLRYWALPTGRVLNIVATHRRSGISQTIVPRA